MVLERAHHTSSGEDSKSTKDKPIRSFSFDVVEKKEIAKGVFQKPTYNRSPSNGNKPTFSRGANTKPIMGHTTNRPYTPQHGGKQ
jgi:hypothetical protein